MGPGGEQVRGRARSYWHVDGIPWLVRGMQAVCWAVVIFFFDREGHSRFLGDAAFFLAICLDRGTILFLKSRITYPRTGYVSPPPPFQVTHDELVLLRLNDDYLSTDLPVTRFKISWLAMVALMLAAYACLIFLAPRIGFYRLAIVVAVAGLLSILLGTARLLGYLRNHRGRVQ